MNYINQNGVVGIEGDCLRDICCGWNYFIDFTD